MATHLALLNPTHRRVIAAQAMMLGHCLTTHLATISTVDLGMVSNYAPSSKRQNTCQMDTFSPFEHYHYHVLLLVYLY